MVNICFWVSRLKMFLFILWLRTDYEDMQQKIREKHSNKLFRISKCMLILMSEPNLLFEVSLHLFSVVVHGLSVAFI